MQKYNLCSMLARQATLELACLSLMSLVALAGCRGGAKPPEEKQPFLKGAATTLISAAKGSIIQAQHIEVEALAESVGLYGMKITVTLRPNSAKPLPSGAEAYCLLVDAFDTTGKRLPARAGSPAELFTNCLAFNVFTVKPFPKTIPFFIPFYYLDLPEGPNSIHLIISGHPASLVRDEHQFVLRELPPKIIGEPDMRIKFSVEANWPESRSFRLSVVQYELDTAKLDPSDSDFHLEGRGSGFPDLQWEARLGDHNVFKSPSKRNTLVYNRLYTTPVMTASANDNVTLAALDHDVFTQPDELAKWTGRWANLSTDRGNPTVLQFGCVKRLTVFRTNAGNAGN